MHRSFLGLLCLLLAAPAVAQVRVDSVRFEQQGDQVVITYDLTGNAPSYEVFIELSTDGGRTFARTPVSLNGDVGNRVTPGRGKRIVWEAMQDAKGLTGEACMFRVTARPMFARFPLTRSDITGIFYDEKNPIVLMWRKPYQVGSVVRGVTIIAIDRTSVTFSWQGQKVVIPLTPKSK